MIYFKYILLKPIYVIYYFFFIFLVCLYSFILSPEQIKIDNSLTTIKNTSFSLIGTSNQRLHEENGYYFYGTSLTFYSYASDNFLYLSNSLFAEIYQEVEGMTYDETSYFNENNLSAVSNGYLLSNQVIISSNLSRKHNLSIGDKIFYKNEDNNYTLNIINIVNLENSILNPDLSYEIGAVLISKDLDLDIEGSYLYFLNQTSSTYSELITKNEILDVYQLVQFRYRIFNIIVLVIPIIIFTSFIADKIVFRHKKMYLNGNSNYLIRNLVLEVSWLILIPLLIGSLIQSLFFSSFYIFLYSLPISMIITVIFVLYFYYKIKREGLFYGK
ncbi:MAG: hypothetical protein M0Q94_15020 [Candidatus Cloacimonetes bacterium]|nr:hypothetical protein [Candidatus Cloacimonadota bacterium]